MKKFYGISVSTVEQLELLPVMPDIDVLELPGVMLESSNFKIPAAFANKKIVVNNRDTLRFFRSLAGSGMGIKQEFFRLISRRSQRAAELNTVSFSLFPDWENFSSSLEYRRELLEVMQMCCGTIQRNDLDLSVGIRLPGGAENWDMLRDFKKSLLYPVRMMADFHPHEPGALEIAENYSENFHFDSDFWRINFDAASGNYLSENLYSRLFSLVRKSGAEKPVMIFSPGEKADRWIFSEISEALMTAGANE